MRFAWLRKNSASRTSANPGCLHPRSLVRMAYNAAFWVFLLPFVTTTDYSTGFIAFTIVIFVRLGTNLLMSNVIQPTPEQFDSFPFRA